MRGEWMDSFSPQMNQIICKSYAHSWHLLTLLPCSAADWILCAYINYVKNYTVHLRCQLLLQWHDRLEQWSFWFKSARKILLNGNVIGQELINHTSSGWEFYLYIPSLSEGIKDLDQVLDNWQLFVFNFISIWKKERMVRKQIYHKCSQGYQLG